MVQMTEAQRLDAIIWGINLTQESLGREFGASQQNVLHWLRGRKMPARQERRLQALEAILSKVGDIELSKAQKARIRALQARGYGPITARQLAIDRAV
jgi:transcriptional regulator with XRE-family HTH domain